MDEKTKELIVRAEASITYPHWIKATGSKAAANIVNELCAALAALSQEITIAHRMMDKDKEDYDQLMERTVAAEARVAQLDKDWRSISDELCTAEARCNVAEARVRVLEADIQRRASQSLDSMEAAFKAKHLLISTVKEYLASDTWDKENEDRDFRQIRYAIERERTTIEAKTIERCAKLMESDYFGWGDAATAIRALAKTT